MKLLLTVIITLTITVVHAQEAKRRRLTNVVDAYPTLSPDNTTLAFKSNRTGNYELFLMNIDGTKLR